MELPKIDPKLQEAHDWYAENCPEFDDYTCWVMAQRDLDSE